ncbi:MAG TPA: SDR family oxidoreductase [Anaeromyxobacteraceae bacterium]|nr:SDR family oxidoreductase [Anaeromyxobacteraceae bacterium]
MGDVVLVTGYPGFIGRQLVRRLAAGGGEQERLRLLVQPKHAARARAELRDLGAGAAEVLEGDVAQMHLGLSGPEYKRLLAEVATVWHLAAVSYLGVEADLVQRVNVEGTRHVLELCRAAPGLTRLNHFSTAYVSGDRVGVILEEELEMGQRFGNHYEESKYRAEVLVRAAMPELPVTVYRPGIVVGDSRTGEIDRFEGPYYLAILLVTSPVGVPLPLPGDGVAPLNVAPVDFVVDAALSISRNPAGVGRTVHVVDPSPLSARKVYQLVAERLHRKLPPVTLPHRVVEALLSLPVLERFYRPQRASIALVNHLALYNCRNLLMLLEGTGIQCPPITSYLDRLIEFVRAEFDRRRQAELEAQVEDPLDPPPAREGS